MSRELPTIYQALHGSWDGDNGLGPGESAVGGVGASTATVGQAGVINSNFQYLPHMHSPEGK